MWECPACRRRFGRSGQGHECAPAMSLDEYLATGPPHEAPVVEAVLAVVEAFGPDVVVEAVSVGVLLKRGRTFAELRPATRWEAVSFVLHEPARHPRMRRAVRRQGNRYHHVANVAAPEELDEDLVALLRRAYDEAA